MPKGSPCSIDGCKNLAGGSRRGWCVTHYTRWRKYGDPHFVKTIHGRDEERFWRNVQKAAPDECWLWLPPPGTHGYGYFSVDGRHVLAHRWSYEHFVGPIPDGFTIDHVKDRGCKHRTCVNPAHLEPVTMGDNVLRGTGPSADNARKTHCIRNHEFTEANTYRPPKRPHTRQCRACGEIRRRKK